MLINISSNSVYISYQGNSLEIPRGGLEIELPRILKQLHDSGSLNTILGDVELGTKMGTRIYVINGPGSFTNLRVGCLCLNMYKSIQAQCGNEIELFTVDKITLLHSLYKKAEGKGSIGIMQGKGLIYIGQKKNGRSLDENGSIEKVVFDINSPEYQRIDRYDGIRNEKMIYFTENNNVFSIHGPLGALCCGAKELGFEKVDQLIPHYMMEPNIQGK